MTHSLSTGASDCADFCVLRWKAVSAGFYLTGAVHITHTHTHRVIVSLPYFVYNAPPDNSINSMSEEVYIRDLT